MEILKTDVLVVGGGGAGMRAALAAREAGSQVHVVSKTPLGKSTCTYLSAGAFTVAAEGMSQETHRQLTLESGRGINDPELVEIFVGATPERVRELERFGVVGKWAKGRFWCEGKISGWGAPLTSALAQACRRQGISEQPWVIVLDLLCEEGRVVGALGFDFRRGAPIAFQSKATVLANGGGGALYLRHDNPVRITGDGYALAFKSGCRLRDMEFVQFIPSGLAEPGKPTYLIAVSLVDAGRIFNSRGEDILEKYGIRDRPLVVRCRDSFSQAIFKEEEEGNQVFLDLRGLGEKDWPTDNFAASQRHLLLKGLSSSEKPVRISPMCHFFMGGAATDSRGNTDVPGLYAAGEVVGGLHGANRLGGNALGEIIVFGLRAGQSAGEWAREQGWPMDFHNLAESNWQTVLQRVKRAGTGLTPRSIRKKVAELLWREGGISRNGQGLRSALGEMERIRQEEFPRVSTETSKEFLEKVELENALLVGEMILRSAALREESRGAHFRKDFPEVDDRRWKGNIFLRKEKGKVRLEFRTADGSN